MNSGQAALIDGKVYYGGGLTTTTTPQGDEIADNLVHCYDPTQDKWTERLPHPPNIKHFRLGQIDHAPVATGGVCKTTRQKQNAVYILDRETQQWKVDEDKVPPMLTARCFHGSVSLPEALVVAGGRSVIPILHTMTATQIVLKSTRRVNRDGIELNHCPCHFSTCQWLF